MYLRFGEKPLKDKYDLKLNLPIGNTSLPPHFRRIDDNIIEVNAPKDFSGSGNMHFNLSATDLEDGETLKAPGGGSAAFVSTTVTTNVTVSLTSLSCKYWDAKARSKWEDAGCEVITFLFLFSMMLIFCKHTCGVRFILSSNFVRDTWEAIKRRLKFFWLAKNYY